MINIIKTSNWNTNRTKIGGKLPPSCRGLFPPFTKTSHSEQYAGREVTNVFYQTEEDLCWAVRYADETHVDLGGPATRYTSFYEVWNGNILVAIICGDDYLTPEEHLAKYRSDSPAATAHLSRYKIPCSLVEQGEEKIIDHFFSKMSIPVGFTADFVEAKYPKCLPRRCNVTRFT